MSISGDRAPVHAPAIPGPARPSRRWGKLPRYYVSTDGLKRNPTSCPVRRVPAVRCGRGWRTWQMIGEISEGTEN